MLCGSAFKNKGVQAMLDAVVEYLPSPVDRPAVTGENDRGVSEERPANDEAPFAALAFKIMTDPYVGQLTFLRVYSGVLASGDTIINSIKSRKERVGRLLQMHANQRDEIKEVRAGDIAAAVGMKDVTTGDTLCDPDKVITLERMVFPEPVISQAVEPKTKADQEKMGIALNRLAQEDPSFRVHTDDESGQTIISGMTSILSQLARDDRIAVVDGLAVDSPKTKQLAEKLKAMGLESVLIITDAVDENLYLASRNLKNVLIVEPRYADPLSLIHYKKVIVTKPAIAKLEEMWG